MGFDSADNINFTHLGSVSKISHNAITVSLTDDISCASCQIKSTCGIANKGSKEIEITNPIDSYQLHEKVQVVLAKSLGIKAIFWAYIFPFILLIFTLIITSSFFQEWLAGLVALGVLVPYYLILYSFKKKMEKVFKISVLKYY